MKCDYCKKEKNCGFRDVGKFKVCEDCLSDNMFWYKGQGTSDIIELDGKLVNIKKLKVDEKLNYLLDEHRKMEMRLFDMELKVDKHVMSEGRHKRHDK